MIVHSQAERRRRQAKVMALLDASGGPLRGLLLRLTTSEQAAGDLLQDLFLRLYESEAFAREEDGFSYAWRTAVNLAIDWRRRHRTERPLDQVAPMPSLRPSPLDTAISSEDTQRVLDVVSRLDEPGRSVVILYFLEQQSYSKEQSADFFDPNAYNQVLTGRAGDGSANLAYALLKDPGGRDYVPRDIFAKAGYHMPVVEKIGITEYGAVWVASYDGRKLKDPNQVLAPLRYDGLAPGVGMMVASARAGLPLSSLFYELVRRQDVFIDNRTGLDPEAPVALECPSFVGPEGQTFARQWFKEQFGITFMEETRPMPVWVIRKKPSVHP